MAAMHVLKKGLTLKQKDEKGIFMKKQTKILIALSLLCSLPYHSALANVYDGVQDWSDETEANKSKYANYSETSPTEIMVQGIDSQDVSKGLAAMTIGFKKGDGQQNISLKSLTIVMDNNEGNIYGIKTNNGYTNINSYSNIVVTEGTTINILESNDANQAVGIWAYKYGSNAADEPDTVVSLGRNSAININSSYDDTYTYDDNSNKSSKGASGIWNKNARVTGENITIKINKELTGEGRYHVYGINHNWTKPSQLDDPFGHQETETVFFGKVNIDLNSLGKAYGYYNCNNREYTKWNYSSNFSAGTLDINLKSEGNFDDGEDEKNIASGIYSYNIFKSGSKRTKESNMNSYITVAGDTEINVTALNNAIGTGIELYGVDKAEFKGTTAITVQAAGDRDASKGLHFNNSNVEMGDVTLKITAENGAACGAYVDNDMTKEHLVDDTFNSNKYQYTDFITEASLKSLQADIKGDSDSVGIRALSKMEIKDGLRLKVNSSKGEAVGIDLGVSEVTTNTDITGKGGYTVVPAEGNFVVSGGTSLDVQGGTDAYGIRAVNKVYQDKNYGGKALFKNDVTLNVVGTDSTTGVVSSGDGSVVTFAKGLLLNTEVLSTSRSVAPNGNALVVENGGQIIVNSTGLGDVFFKGDVIAGNTGGNTQTGAINVNFATAGSGFTGTSTVSGSNTIDFTFNNGAGWDVTGDASLTNLNIFNGSLVDLTKGSSDTTLTAKKLSGTDGVIKMDIDGTGGGDKLVLESHEGSHLLKLNNSGSGDAKGTVIASVGDEQGRFAVEDSEGTLHWTETVLDAVNNAGSTDWTIKGVHQVDPEEKATASVAATLSVNALNYYTWRTENDRLMKRMGELRYNGEDAKGIWLRVSGSKIGGSGKFGFENKYTAYELGYDEVVKQTAGSTCYQGLALSYADGQGSYSHGNGDNSNKAISFYTTEIGSKGHYLDVVFKLSNLENDFTVFDTNGKKITGDFNNTGIALSAEYGRKNYLPKGWFIEPQAQFTLGYLGGDSYSTSNGIAVSQSGIKSAVGRLGFNVGKQMSSKGLVYLKANVLHEFGGAYNVTMSDSSDRLKVTDTFNDTWFEYGIGAGFALSNNSTMYFEVERSVGGDVTKNWGANLGVQYSF